jgi:DNA adenine methylase
LLRAIAVHSSMASMPTSGPRRLTRRSVEMPRLAHAAAAEPASDAATPIVKWAGGKTRLLDELCARVPLGYRRYFEPFLGGAALYFRLAPRFAVLSDSNPDLINMYRCVSGNVEAVIRRLARHRTAHSTEYYYEMRETWNQPGGLAADVERAAAFIYLNKTCYNGLWRVNSSGRFNVPIGRYDDPSIFDPDALRAAARLLQRAEIRTSHFADSVAEAEAGDLVYFDPPYHPLSDTARFTSYTAGSFGPDDQRELAGVARVLCRRGCAVMISNSDTPFVRELYRGFRIDVVDCPRAINSRGTGRGPQRELIIRG